PCSIAGGAAETVMLCARITYATVTFIQTSVGFSFNPLDFLFYYKKCCCLSVLVDLLAWREDVAQCLAMESS
ncbi:hypothetical protein TNIN_40701, partial [Trichonephila inaurata madagascariensis]